MGKGYGVRGVALGLAVAVTLGASSGMLLSRVSAEAAPRNRPQPLALPLPSPDDVEAAAETVEPVRDPFPPGKACGGRDARTVSWRVRVGRGVPLSEAAFARGVHRVLCDARGWIASGGVRFRYDPDGDFLISLRTAERTERRCLRLIGLSVHARWSCAGSSEAVLNADRWFNASPTLRLSVRRYRALLVNHEVGHLLGHGHRGCSASGEKAPVMMQQSKGLGGCRANPWPLDHELSARG